MEKIRDAGSMASVGSGEARGFLIYRFEREDLNFLAGVWGFVIGVMGYVLIFKP